MTFCNLFCQNQISAHQHRSLISMNNCKQFCLGQYFSRKSSIFGFDFSLKSHKCLFFIPVSNYCYRPRTYVRREVMFSQVCVCSGGLPDPALDGGRGGTWSSLGWGGRSQSRLGQGRGYPNLGRGGYPISGKEKNFWHQIWLDTCSHWKKFFFTGGPPLPVKGKIFDTRFGLIHVQTGNKIFCRGTPPPPTVKGKFFDTRFGLIHVQTGKKKFRRGTTPPPWNSKLLLRLRGGRCASCVHAGGLSCFTILFYLLGQHSWYNVTAEMSCDDFWPMFLLYNGQELDAFGWAFQGNYESPRYEHPTADVLGVSYCRYFCTISNHWCTWGSTILTGVHSGFSR